MNREVMGRQMFAHGGSVYPMQDGGIAPMSPMPEQAPAPMMPAPMAPAGMDMQQAAQGAAAQGIDPAQLESMLGDYDQQMTSLGEAEDYEGVINSIRGDQLPINARYEELASMVGQEDASATPESVLTLIQPVMQMAAVDQGIGGLAQDEMSAPIEGPMAEGIMSTVNMGAMEGPDPVNFSQGGAVRYMAFGGDPTLPAGNEPALPQTLRQRYDEEVDVMQGIIGTPEDKAQAYADQQKMTKAQMLFDVAQGALAFASPGDRQMSPAERLAQSFSPVMGSIGARAGDLQKFKQDQGKEGQALKLQALGSAQASMLQQQKETGESERAASQQAATAIEGALGRSSQESMLETRLSFDKRENETDRSYQERLANKAIRAQTALAKLQGRIGLDADAARAVLQQELAILNGNIAATSQQNVFDFTTGERVSTQSFKTDMQSALYANQQTLLALENNYSTEATEQKNRLTQDNMKLAEQISVAAVTVNYENDMKKAGVMNAYDLNKMAENFSNTIKGMKVTHDLTVNLADHNASLATDARDHQNAFNAGQSVLAYAQANNVQMSDQEFRAALQEDMQKFNLTEAETNRAMLKLNRAFDEGLATRGADQKDTQLTLAERAQLLDETYKLGTLAIDQAAAKSVALGSKATTATINYLSDPTRLANYEAGTLGETETAVFEQLILDYTSAKPVFDGTNWIPGSATQLSPAIRRAMEKREDLGNGNIVLGGYVRLDQTKAALTPEQIEANKLPAEITTLEDATTDLFNADGTVNKASPAWGLTAPNRFKPGLDYREVVGASRIFPGIGKMFSEGSSELLGGPASPRAQKIAQAATGLEALANDLLLYSTNQADGRVLKFVQEKIEREVANIRPGGLFLRTDADAAATFETLSDMIAQQMQLGANILPEYNGTVGEYTPAVVAATREDMNVMKVYMNEVLAFREGFQYKPKVITQAVGGQDQSTATAQSQIQQMRKANSQ